MKRAELAGNKYGKLTVLSYCGNSYWECKCECGNICRKSAYTLTRGVAIQCLTCSHKRHGMSRSPEYKVWQDILQRCNNPNEPNYKRYGARGIKICERWANSFEKFYEDVGPRPSRWHELDRTDNNGDYEPDNVRWVTCRQNNWNRRNNRYFVIDGVKKCLAEWCEEYKMNYSCITARLDRGWNIEEALTTPANENIWAKRRKIFLGIEEDR